MSIVHPARASSTASSNSAWRRFTCVGLKTRAGISLSRSARRTSSRPARAVAEVQVQDAGLAGHEARDVGVGRETQDLVEGGLAGTVIADRDFADAEQRLEQDQVGADAGSECGQRHVVATRIAVGVEAFLAQRVHLGEQVARTAGDVVGAEQADDGRHAGERVASERHGGTRVLNPASPPPPVTCTWPSMRPGISRSPARSMVRRAVGQCGRQCRQVAVGTHPENLAAAEEEGLQAQRARRMDVGVAEEKHAVQISRRRRAAVERGETYP